jgi:hypothetical protein
MLLWRTIFVPSILYMLDRSRENLLGLPPPLPLIYFLHDVLWYYRAWLSRGLPGGVK